MKMLLVGAGAVGESILRILQARDKESKWLNKVVVADCCLERAQEVVSHLQGDPRFIAEHVDAKDKSSIVELIKNTNVILLWMRLRRLSATTYLTRLTRAAQIMETWGPGLFQWMIRNSD